jgi:hypothetical protein
VQISPQFDTNPTTPISQFATVDRYLPSPNRAPPLIELARNMGLLQHA